MKEIRKAAVEKSKKAVGKSSRLSKKDDSGRPCLPKVVGIKVKYEKFMVGMFNKFVYNNIRPTYEEVQTLDLQMIEGFQLKEAESGFPPEIIVDYFDKRPAIDVQSQVDLDIQGFEEFSTVPPTEILKKAGLITDASTSHQTKKQKTVRFDSTTVEEQVFQKTPSFVSTRTVPIQKIASSSSERVHAEKKTPSSSLKSVCQDNSNKKWDDIKLFLQSYIFDEIDKSTDVYSADDPMDGHYFDLNRSPIQQQSQDIEGCSEDNATASLDAFVESVVNHNSDNTNVGTSTTVHVHNDYMDVEGVSADIWPAILECLVAAMENQKPDNDNVRTSNMQVDYSSTLSESTQVELDAILKVTAAPVDDVPIEEVPPAGLVVNQHDISDS
ncbi:hypothetical protein CQW23_03366 [Capsicum baccatum]|uniref:Uncharacterized protein n=1 Tax=Capsicum baccatum TaxID=33114 RepID=A0A2G2XBM2_CAPBA|nr:hypothetical protein CQW23_03366 [Capsicum baccatum]